MINNLKKEKGITLVALIITIIIMLILTGVTINIAIGENGIFSQSKIAVEKYKNEAQKEEDQLNNIQYHTLGQETELPDNTEDNPQEIGAIVKLPNKWATKTAKYISTENGTEITNYTDVATVYAVSVGNAKTIPVPIGFYYVGGDLDTGVVISDDPDDEYHKGTTEDKTTHSYAPNLKGNQFVWIPCDIDDYKKIDWKTIYPTKTLANAEWDRTTNAAEYNQIEKYGGFYIGRYEAGVATLKEDGTFDEKVKFSNNKSLVTAVAIQTPLVSNWGWQNYDYTARETGTAAKTGSNKVTEGNIVERANSIPYYHADYYTAKEMSKKMYNNNDYVQSGLTTGTMWDMMTKYIKDKATANGTTDVSSTNWGNYDNVSLSNLRGAYTNVTSSGSSVGATDGFKSVNDDTNGITNTNGNTSSYVLLTTGSTEQVMKLHLYDVAGNLWEWTDEASYMDNVDYNLDEKLDSFMLRGGAFCNGYTTVPASYRACNFAPNTSTNLGFRPALFIK